jgi:hypothetical protein
MQTICRCYLSEQVCILGWLFVTTLYCNLSLPYRLNVFQQIVDLNWEWFNSYAVHPLMRPLRYSKDWDMMAIGTLVHIENAGFEATALQT